MSLPIRLVRTDENVDEISALADRYGGTVGLSAVVDHLNRQGEKVPVPGRQVDWGFTWNESDRTTTRWWPQGITTSADAFDTEDLDGRRLLITSWYSKDVDGVSHGSRITVVDIDTLEYRHVLLVTTVESFGGQRLQPLHVHAGGLVWCGPYLHIAATRRGLFSARLDDIIEVDPDDAFGYRFVLPVRFAYRSTATEGAEQMRYSFLSLDRSASPPELVAGEYGTKGMTTRLARYPLDPETWHLHSGDDGESEPAGLESGIGHMQGATTVHGRWYVTTSRGQWRLGHLRVGTPGHFRTLARALPTGPEDIAYWPSTGRLWSLTEHPGKRWVFCVDRASADRAAKLDPTAG